MQNLATETVRKMGWRRAGVVLLRAARRPWGWVALAYLALAVTLAADAPSFTRFLGSLVWATLGLGLVAWTVIVWRIVHVSAFRRE